MKTYAVWRCRHQPAGGTLCVGAVRAALRGGQQSLRCRLFLGRYGHICQSSVRVPDNNVINMARHELRMHLRAVLEEATLEKMAVVREGVHVKTNGSYQTVCLKIRPIPATVT